MLKATMAGQRAIMKVRLSLRIMHWSLLVRIAPQYSCTGSGSISMYLVEPAPFFISLFFMFFLG